jgi:(S)-ureidoglycine aminohydrolase
VNFAEGYALLTREGIRSGRSRNFNYKDTYVHALAVPAYSSDFYAYLTEMGKKGATLRSIEEESEFFVYALEGAATLNVNKDSYEMSKGDYAYLPPETAHSIESVSISPFSFLMIKRKYIPAGSESPRFIYGSEKDVPEERVPEENRTRKYLIPNEETAFDMGATILKFQPGAGTPIVETHVQHHGILILSGTCLWYLGHKWYQSKTGDFIWLMPFTRHSVWCIGNSQSSCLVYKNWNR